MLKRELIKLKIIKYLYSNIIGWDMNNYDYYNFDSNCNSGSTLDSIINGLPLDDLADALLSNANNPNNQFTYCDFFNILLC